jgi:hypothetical protein
MKIRIEEAERLFRWVRPLHESDRIYTPGYGIREVITP